MPVPAHVTSGVRQQWYKSSTRPLPQQCSILQWSAEYAYRTVKSIFTVVFSCLYGNIMPSDIQGLLYRTYRWGAWHCNWAGGEKKEKKIIHQNPVTVTIFMRQHVYTTAEKHSSIFKLLLISFTHSLELMNARDPWSQSFLALNIKRAWVMLTLESPCCQHHGSFSGLLEKCCFSSQLYKMDQLPPPNLSTVIIINPPYVWNRHV